MVLGIDTSNYTTSVAFYDGTEGKNCSRLLDVKPGELGLRQSDAVFAHVKRLPELVSQLVGEKRSGSQIRAIGVSTRPRAVNGSYMPCFLVGDSLARCLGAVLQVPVFSFSHQQGHIAASLWSSNRMDLLKKKHLAWHLSGGTTELLLVEPDGQSVQATKLGGTSDISAGQLVDRTGKLLGFAFPAGKELDRLSLTSQSKETFPVKVKNLTFSLSGMENKVQKMAAQGANPGDIARFCLGCICSAIQNTTADALRMYPDYPVVFSGGVASNTMLRETFQGNSFVFCPPQYATDNAMGVAVLTWLQEEKI